MSKVIVRPNVELGTICVIYPVLECGLTLEEIALKDVPKGLPFVYVEREDVPHQDIEYWSAWECDFSNPDGYGMGYEDFFAMKGAE
jgi:hypothetical protein